MKCASEKWKEVFVVNELSFEPLEDSCTSDRDTPIFIAKDVLKYPEQVREFIEMVTQQMEQYLKGKVVKNTNVC